MKNEKEKVLDILKEHLQSLVKRHDSLRKPLEEVEQEMEHVAATIRSFERDVVVAESPVLVLTNEAPPVSPASLHGMTQLQAIITIARHNGGVVRAQEAKRALIRAGLMRQTKNSTNIVHSTISRSGKFERIAPGEFKLTDDVTKLYAVR